MKRKFFNRRTFALITGVLLFLFANAFAQSNEDCLMCHDDDTCTMEKDGKEISISVNEVKFNASKHSNLKCVSCHTNFDPEDVAEKLNLALDFGNQTNGREKIKHLDDKIIAEKIS